MSLLVIGGGGMAGLGDVASGKSIPQRAAELKAALDQVTTSAQASQVIADTRKSLADIADGLGVLVSASMVRGWIQPTIDRLDAALLAMPWLDGPVDEKWTGVPDGGRRAVESGAAALWSLERNLVGESLDATDVSTFADGFSDSIKNSITTVASLPGRLIGAAARGVGIGLGDVPTWVWVVGGLALAGWGVSKVKAVRELLL